MLANQNYDLRRLQRQIGAYNYIDMEATWHPTKILTVRAGVNNILDKDPPLLVTQTGLIAGGTANTSDAYDMFGRQLFVAFTAKF